MGKRKNKFIHKKKVILDALREGGPLTFEALQFETSLEEYELLSEVFKYVQKGWIRIVGGQLPIQPDSILDINYMR